MNDLPQSLSGDLEDQVANMALDFCTREERKEPVSMDEYLRRKPLCEHTRAAEEFTLLVNMHRLLRMNENFQDPEDHERP